MIFSVDSCYSYSGTWYIFYKIRIIYCCDIEDFVETRICKLSRALCGTSIVRLARVAWPHWRAYILHRTYIIPSINCREIEKFVKVHTWYYLMATIMVLTMTVVRSRYVIFFIVFSFCFLPRRRSTSPCDRGLYLPIPGKHHHNRSCLNTCGVACERRKSNVCT